MPPLHGNLLDPYKQEHNERNLLCEYCIVTYTILEMAPITFKLMGFCEQKTHPDRCTCCAMLALTWTVNTNNQPQVRCEVKISDLKFEGFDYLADFSELVKEGWRRKEKLMKRSTLVIALKCLLDIN